MTIDDGYSYKISHNVDGRGQSPRQGDLTTPVLACADRVPPSQRQSRSQCRISLEFTRSYWLVLILA